MNTAQLIESKPVPLWTPWGDMTAPPAANDNLPPVIALTGLAGAGKSTAADYLIDRYGYVRVRFSGPLKAMCEAIGLTHSEIEGDLKEVPTARLSGKTPRQFMQILGTEFGRKMIGANFWVDLWYEELSYEPRVVVEDCRFPNEAEAVKSLGGVIWKIEGRGGIACDHASEAGCGQFDAVIDNSGGREALHGAIDGLIRRVA